MLKCKREQKLVQYYAEQLVVMTTMTGVAKDKVKLLG